MATRKPLIPDLPTLVARAVRTPQARRYLTFAEKKPDAYVFTPNKPTLALAAAIELNTGEAQDVFSRYWERLQFALFEVELIMPLLARDAGDVERVRTTVLDQVDKLVATLDKTDKRYQTIIETKGIADMMGSIVAAPAKRELRIYTPMARRVLAAFERMDPVLFQLFVMWQNGEMNATYYRAEVTTIINLFRKMAKMIFLIHDRTARALIRQRQIERSKVNAAIADAAERPKRGQDEPEREYAIGNAPVEPQAVVVEPDGEDHDDSVTHEHVVEALDDMTALRAQQADKDAGGPPKGRARAAH